MRSESTKSLHDGINSTVLIFKTGDPMDDLGIVSQDPLIPPQILQMEEPLNFDAKTTIFNARKAAARILKGTDDRLIVVGNKRKSFDISF